MIGRKGPDMPDYPMQLSPKTRRLTWLFVGVVYVYTLIVVVIVISALLSGVRP